jgi:hypothetical protein
MSKGAKKEERILRNSKLLTYCNGFDIVKSKEDGK